MPLLALLAIRPIKHRARETQAYDVLSLVLVLFCLLRTYSWSSPLAGWGGQSADHILRVRLHALELLGLLVGNVEPKRPLHIRRMRGDMTLGIHLDPLIAQFRQRPLRLCWPGSNPFDQ